MTIINDFSKGITADSRDSSRGVSRYVSNFDIFTTSRLVPYYSSEDGNSNASNDLMSNWCIAYDGTAYRLFGLGRQTASAKVRIFKKSLTTGASTDLDDNGWTEGANNTAAAQVVSIPGVESNCFVYYPKLNMIFGIHGSRYVYEYDPDGGTAFNETDFDITNGGTAVSSIAQGFVHSKDDILYIPVDNKIIKNDNGTWNAGSGAGSAALTLPSQYYITSICEFGDYIAIMAAHKDGVSSSRVFIWNRSSLLATVKESINWGTGAGKVIEEINGYLIGVSLDSGQHKLDSRLVIRYYLGAGAITVRELSVSASAVLYQAKQKINSRVHFMMTATINGTRRDGVWSFGRTSDGTFNLVHERTPNNDTAITSGALRGFFYCGDYLFQAFTIDAGTHTVTKTDDSGAYSHTSTWQSVINENMALVERPYKKQLKSVAVTYTPLGTNGQVVLKYRVDSTGSYTTIFTETTDGVQFTEMVAAGSNAFTAGRDYEFLIESTGGAEITSFYYDAPPLETNI